MKQSLAEQMAGTALSGANAAFIEELYDKFHEDPASIPAEWAAYFGQLAPGNGSAPTPGAAPTGGIKHTESRHATSNGSTPVAAKQGAVSRLMQVYANRGHLVAKLDPLGLQERPWPTVLTLGHFGLTEADLDTEFFTDARNEALPARAKLRDILSRLQLIYCGTIGAEFAHVSDGEERSWLQDNFQLTRMQNSFTGEEKQNILWQLSAAEGLERYLHSKYVGQKRFSLEGGESLIAQLDDLVQQAGRAGVEEAVIGMAHRGRLNVLVNLLGKSPRDLFNEFEGR
jgi:2-oxoglutarate dehydrogenase E1 component